MIECYNDLTISQMYRSLCINYGTRLYVKHIKYSKFYITIAIDRKASTKICMALIIYVTAGN